MTTIQFYHLTTTSLERALPKLLEKALSGGLRVLVRTASEESAERLSQLLWTYDPNSFLPHGTAKDGHSEAQPIYLTAREENPNAARVLCLSEGVTPADFDGFDKVLDLFDGQDEAAVTAARVRWKHWEQAGYGLAYFKQTAQGGWEKVMEKPASSTVGVEQAA